jgi:hypothetical protein
MNKELLLTNARTLLTLEWLGVRFDETKEEKDSFGFVVKQSYYFSVPETSTIRTEDEVLNEKIKTADGLKRLAKEYMLEVIINTYKDEYGEDDFFLEELKSNPSNFFTFYAKVRNGETWTKELGDKRIEELNAEIQKVSGYEVIT